MHQEKTPTNHLHYYVFRKFSEDMNFEIDVLLKLFKDANFCIHQTIFPFQINALEQTRHLH